MTMTNNNRLCSRGENDVEIERQKEKTRLLDG
jgi:hypothetical protein